jgi:hypothetical protein
MGWTFYNSSGEALVQHAESEAVQSEMEAETAVAKFVPPDLVKNSPGVAKAWVKYEQDSGHSAADSYNVTSVIDNGVGQTTIAWGTDFGDADYAVTGSSVNGEVIDFLESSIAAGSIDARTRGMSDNSAVDNSNNWVVAFGDQ